MTETEARSAGGTEQPWAMPVGDVVDHLGVEPERGLSDDEVARRRSEAGPNVLDETDTIPWWQIVLDQIRSAVVALLFAAVVAGVLIGELVEAGAVAVVLIVNTVVGFVTELRAVRSMEALSELTATIADVERDGRRDEIDAADLVPGDIVSLAAGDQIPADLRLLEASDLTVEESALTGESAPVGKQTDALPPETVLAERDNMAFSGTTVAGGRGRGVVVATGTTTEVGRIADLAAATDITQAPLQAGLERLGRTLSLVVVALAAGLALLGWLRGLPPSEIVEISVALAVAVVPEGLPAVATLTLTVGMRRMARADALVRRLPTVETLGSTTVIASDKTGTLTANEMRVVELVVVDGGDDVDVWRAAVLCNDADIDPDGDPVGDPTEVALLLGAEEAGVDWRTLRDGIERLDEAPFDAATKRMAVVVGDEVLAKGAPEVMVDDDRHHDLAEAAHRFTDRGLRTLAIGIGKAPDGARGDRSADEALFAGVEPLAVVGIQDPPRPAAIDAIAACHRAGIRVVMITGDQARTARVIARELGLRDHPVVTGADLDDLDDDELAAVTADTDVFARATPEHKLRLVAAMQAAGEVVAVTGDGVNDAPALRQADVGIAMGRAGTDVARDAADIVLTTDDFSTIESAVEEGRRILQNIRRFGQFLFSWHLAVVATVVVAIAAGLDPPLAGLMILWNNLIIDVIPSFALALEPSGDDAMNEPPRAKDEPVLGTGTVRRIAVHGALVATAGLAAYLLGLGPFDAEIATAQTMAFVALTAAQLLAVFNARTDHGSGFRGAGRNPYLWVALAVTVALEAVALGVPALRELLGLTTLTATEWGVALTLATLPLAAVQLSRLAAQQRDHRQPEQ